MPTGYTHRVAEGEVTDFRTFALQCARAFGATIMQRDDPGNEPPKLREEAPFYADMLSRAETRFREVDGMTTEAAERGAADAHKKALDFFHERRADRTETANRYSAMLAEVLAWGPPTPAHVGLKEFMTDQLTESRRFDCEYDLHEPTRERASEWLATEFAAAARNLNRARQSLADEQERVRCANAWINALYESLIKPEDAQ